MKKKIEMKNEKLVNRASNDECDVINVIDTETQIGRWNELAMNTNTHFLAEGEMELCFLPMAQWKSKLKWNKENLQQMIKTTQESVN